jgi:hypothetical protein
VYLYFMHLKPWDLFFYVMWLYLIYHSFFIINHTQRMAKCFLKYWSRCCGFLLWEIHFSIRDVFYLNYEIWVYVDSLQVSSLKYESAMLIFVNPSIKPEFFLPYLRWILKKNLCPDYCNFFSLVNIDSVKYRTR